MSTQKDMPKKIRLASTVILVRAAESEETLQVYLLRRSQKSGFFPGNYVFPGGALDPDEWDTSFWQAHLDVSPRELHNIFKTGLTVEELVAYGVAAIRETLEEAGVLLARKTGEGRAPSGCPCERPSQEDQYPGWFKRKIAGEGWQLSFSCLLPWSHWITPEVMPKRFDTRFFIAPMPKGQICKPDDRETTHGVWMSPRKALEENARGEVPLTPPTLVTLHSLLPFKTLKELSEGAVSRSWGPPILPFLFLSERGRFLVEPWDPDYGRTPEIGPGDLEDKILPVGEPFSRLWMREGIWRPIKTG
jgi:8-oxo-dGTP pyrophosphatase MutT (NUDIX family)